MSTTPVVEVWPARIGWRIAVLLRAPGYPDHTIRHWRLTRTGAVLYAQSWMPLKIDWPHGTARVR